MRLLLPLLLLCAPADAAVIKFATLAPEGSTWMKMMRELAAEVEQKTGGGLTFRFYPGGASGDEKDVVRKIRIGQLHAAGFTGVGLGEIAPAVRLLDAPFLIGSAEEADLLMTTLDAAFRKEFDQGGYVLLGWSEVGLVYVFSGKPIASVEDLRRSKCWTWEGDPIAESLFDTLRVSPVPLSVVDVRPSMQTGLIDAVYGSPLAVVVLQWYQKALHRFALPITNASGAVVISKKAFDALPAEHRKVLQEVSAVHLRRLTEATRRENEQALKTLAAHGVKTVEPASPAVVEEFRAAGIAARKALTGKIYPVALLEQAEKALAGLRSRGSAKTKDPKSPAPTR